MKYIKIDTSYFQLTEESQAFKDLAALPVAQRPIFLDATDADVVAYLAAQAIAANLAQAQVLKREAIDEVIREQFADLIAERVAQKKAELEKQRNG